MGLESKIKCKTKVLTGFNELTLIAISIITLDITNPPIVSSQTFMIVSNPSPHNKILARPWLVKTGAVTLIEYYKIRFRIPGGAVGEIKSDQAMFRRCTVQVLKELKKKSFAPAQLQQAGQENDVKVNNVLEDESRWKIKDDAENIILDLYQPEKTARIGSCLSPAENEELKAFLKENRDIFAWSPSNMPGINPAIACHKLHVDPAAKPVIQKRRHFAPKRIAIIEAEINKLLEARFIEEVAHSIWLVNVMLVMKKEKGK
ncbi:uncharacterized protein [Pyrus communis]|uniref:uncharacterized protein n=1 Tax=Pyrus communis TaxID=23211 RepID=UPI0035C11086